MEKPGSTVILEPGAAQTFVVMGLSGGDHKADLTGSPYLKMIATDPGIVEVDRKNARLVGKAPGETEIHLSFSEATSIVKVVVRKRV